MLRNVLLGISIISQALLDSDRNAPIGLESARVPRFRAVA